jgi:hypothetical protein
MQEEFHAVEALRKFQAWIGSVLTVLKATGNSNIPNRNGFI